MKLIEKLTKKFVKTASTQTKAELKKTAIDLLPTVMTLITTIAGIVIFKGVIEEPTRPIDPHVSSTTITTNNYFFRDMSEEASNKILEERK